MNRYHYTECGLNNVYIVDMPVVYDDDGDQVVTIPHINELHRTIATGIVCHEAGISADELRFVRSEMGLTQAELAKLVHKDKQTIGRWERAETEIDSTSETIIRKFAIERLELSVDAGIDVLSEHSVPSAHDQMINVRATKESYELDKEAA